MTYLPTAQLVAEIKKSDTTPTSGTATSLPIPVLENHRLLVAVFVAPAGYDADARASVLSPPQRVTFFDPATGLRVREDAMVGGSPLGTEPFDVPRSEYAQLIAQLFDAYDVLMPAFAERRTAATPALQAAAKTYKKLFPRFAGKLLDRYYKAIGQDWFAWLDRMAGA